MASNLTFDEIEAEYGEETAINVGIAQDPDAPEWTEEDWARARPAIEVDIRSWWNGPCAGAASRRPQPRSLFPSGSTPTSPLISGPAGRAGRPG